MTISLFEVDARSTTDKIEALMADGCERHRAQIERDADLTTAPQTTLRRLRDLRDRGYTVHKRSDDSTPGLYWYRVTKRGASPVVAKPARLSTAQKRTAYEALRASYFDGTLPNWDALDDLMEWLRDE